MRLADVRNKNPTRYAYETSSVANILMSARVYTHTSLPFFQLYLRKLNCFDFSGLASYDTILILTSILMFGIPAVHTYTQKLFRQYFYDVFPFITPTVYPIGIRSVNAMRTESMYSVFQNS